MSEDAIRRVVLDECEKFMGVAAANGSNMAPLYTNIARRLVAEIGPAPADPPTIDGALLTRDINQRGV